MGLNDSYSQIRGQILMMDPLLAINKVFSLVLQEERHRHISVASNSSVQTLEPMAFGSHSSNSARMSGGFKTRKDKVTCSHCGFLGPTKEKCYTLVGYPPG